MSDQEIKRQELIERQNRIANEIVRTIFLSMVTTLAIVLPIILNR